MRHSPIEEEHLAAGARMVDFAGWSMPVQYTSIREEHEAVRTAAGIFDISHMGELLILGPGGEAWLEKMLTNRISKLKRGCGQYTFMLNDEGGVIDDLILYRYPDSLNALNNQARPLEQPPERSPEGNNLTEPVFSNAKQYVAPNPQDAFFLVINAARCEEDLSWLMKHHPHDGSVHLENRSDTTAAVALQGPKSEDILRKIFGDIALPRRYEMISQNVGPENIELLIARTGYTGEDGFEIFIENKKASSLWKSLVASGARPCGLGARDTLRLEMGYPLNGSDLMITRTPLEAGLGKFIALKDPLKNDFLGRKALEQVLATGLTSRLTPLCLCEDGPPLRSHYLVFSKEEMLGEITSGAYSPSLGKSIAMAYLPLAWSEVGKYVEIEIRGKRYQAEVTTLPFYRHPCV